MSPVQIEEISYRRWRNCLRVRNKKVDLVVLKEAGPRIIRFGFADDANVFGELSPESEEHSGIEVNVLGGHRLWHAPEVNPRTYQSDAFPVGITENTTTESSALRREGFSTFLRISQRAERLTGIRKEMDVTLHDTEPSVKVVHRLINENVWTVDLAPWAITVMEKEGTAIVPLPPRGSHMENLSPTLSLAIWPYTNLADSRFHFGERFITLTQDPTNTLMQKIGIRNTVGWVAYLQECRLFVKQIHHNCTASYPDLGSSAEIFTNEQILEIETLGPMSRIEPGQAVEHVETWHLHRDVPGFSNETELQEIADRYRLKASS